MKYKHFLFWIVIALSVAGCSKPAETEKQARVGLHATRGSESAPYTIEQVSDFLCPYCKQQAAVLIEVMRTYPDKFRWIFRHLPLSGQPGTGSFPLHEASVCAEEQGKFWEFHDAIFTLNDVTNMQAIVTTLKLDEKKFGECIQTGKYRPNLLAEAADAEARGVTGTPTFFMNGEKVTGLRPFEYFAEIADPTIRQKNEAERKRAKEELLAKINPSEEGRPQAGPSDAPVTITEFSDFHCPYCTKLTGVLKQVMENFPQDVRRVWRHFPLPMHPQAGYAHLASECAHEQGKFWEFHGELFKEGAGRDLPAFEQIATSLQLDLAKFRTCFDSPETKKKIENDVLLGFSKELGSTPIVFINEEMFIGARPYEEYEAIIKRKVTEAAKKT